MQNAPKLQLKDLQAMTRNLLVMFLMTLSLAACGKKEEAAPVQAPAPEAAAPAPAPTEPAATPAADAAAPASEPTTEEKK
jgi:hypothetical protein